MTTGVANLLDRLADIGAEIRPAGDRLIVRAGANPVPAELMRRLRQTKAEVLAALGPMRDGTRNSGLGVDDPAWWRRQFAVRTIAREVGGNRAHAEAVRLAFGDLVSEWHRRHGIRTDQDRCAGCGEGLPVDVGMIVDQGGVRVHFDAVRGFDCLLAYGQRWRSNAAAALGTIGLEPPTGFTLP
jgi:hypothetical protein